MAMAKARNRGAARGVEVFAALAVHDADSVAGDGERQRAAQTAMEDVTHVMAFCIGSRGYAAFRRGVPIGVLRRESSVDFGEPPQDRLATLRGEPGDQELD